MSNIGSYAEGILLNWVLGAFTSTGTAQTTAGAAPTRPTYWAVGLGGASPTTSSSYEVGPGSGYARQTPNMASVTAGGTASNLNPMTFGPFSSTCSLSGIQIWDTTAVTAGNMLWYGALATPRTLGVGDSIVIAAGQLTISLS
jgi:hypothetical protein